MLISISNTKFNWKYHFHVEIDLLLDNYIIAYQSHLASSKIYQRKL